MRISERATEKARERRSSVFSGVRGKRSFHCVATGQCALKSPTYIRSRIRACNFLKHTDRSYCAGIYPSLHIRLHFHLQKYCIQMYTQSCTFLLSVCPILKTRQTTHKTEITEYLSPDSLFSVINLEKNVGSSGAWPKMEDGRGLLSGMIERSVAYLVAVHPQIV